ncbi:MULTISPECIES: hypothetical protein [unclassified Paracoccus (in: a-proteobacteria)]|uniref:hypothetical protein n=1 Tax=unclassified Paracoccus (in: a-proteobacteria) TaxID=2688777 RepID=UPI0015FFB6F3|nr:MULTISPECIES: hypothetical protein [unclassified Paracoccus (in: a-proteobacteria)]MBB1497240.1 hypothetical protein [Paracoccus sp. MC1862]
MNRASLRLWIGRALIVTGPVLAGLGSRGGWTVGLFALLAVFGLVLAAPAESWRSPFHLAAVTALAALGCVALYVGADAVSRSLGWSGNWGGLGPLALSAAGAVLAGTGWFPVRGGDG